MRYVIIGNSAAGIGCVEGIRQMDPSGGITLISAEPYHTYSRPLISYLLQGKTDLERMKYRPDDFYDKMGCDVLLGYTVTHIDPVSKEVSLEDGRKMGYDKLMVAAGSKPFVPPMEGLEQVEKKFSFMSLKDAEILEQSLTPESRVLIIGAGLIGLKCAEGICDKVKEITVVDLAQRILPSVLDEEGSQLVQEHIEKQGIKMLLGQSAKKFSPYSAILTGGDQVDFDVLVVAVGVRPNTELVAEAGGKVDRGIVVDENGCTSLPDVYAAGDCSQGVDITTGQSHIMALLPNAYMQGEAAGVHMAGGAKPFDKAIPMNAVGFFGLHIVTAGSYEGQSECFVKDGHYKKLVTKDNLLKGFILIGDVSRAGIYASLIRERTPLDTIDFDLIKENPQLMAFSKLEREKKLGGRRA